ALGVGLGAPAVRHGEPPRVTRALASSAGARTRVIRRMAAPAAPRLLVVDDDASVRASLALLLKQHGYASAAAATPAEALALLSAEPFDLVLQDMNFSRQTSGEEGLALLREVRALRPELPVVLITA